MAPPSVLRWVTSGKYPDLLDSLRHRLWNGCLNTCVTGMLGRPEQAGVWSGCFKVNTVWPSSFSFLMQPAVVKVTAETGIKAASESPLCGTRGGAPSGQMCWEEPQTRRPQIKAAGVEVG